ncbi:MAG TPA: hypothetical protein VH120_16315, partial [Gemmataceae bacterium]|nr:hypothetical protein [Gemmataceae bacterium]
MERSDAQQPDSLPNAAPGRRMVRAELLGGHTHQTTSGVMVHVWLRDGRYLARGSFQGGRFGKTLGDDPVRAAAELRHLLAEIEDGRFVRPSEDRDRPLSRGPVPNLTLRDLVNDYVLDRRDLRGTKTAGDYECRLRPVLDFAERS